MRHPADRTRPLNRPGLLRHIMLPLKPRHLHNVCFPLSLMPTNWVQRRYRHLADPFFVPNDPMFNVSFDPNYSFGSEAANLEYSILSAILGNPSPPESSPPQQPYSSTLPSSSNPEWPNDPQQPSQVDPYSEYSAYPSQSLPESDPISNQPTDSAFATESTFYNTTYPQALPNTDQSYVALPQDERSSALRPQYRARSPSQTVPTRTSTTHAPNSPASESSGAARSVVQTINDCVTAPYDYTEGYHFLMKHLPNRCVRVT
jgi:hypothetical protein